MYLGAQGDNLVVWHLHALLNDLVEDLDRAALLSGRDTGMQQPEPEVCPHFLASFVHDEHEPVRLHCVPVAEACTDCRAVGRDVRPAGLLERLQDLDCSLALANSAKGLDERRVCHLIRLQASVLHLLEEPSGLLCPATVHKVVDHDVVARHRYRDPLPLHLLPESVHFVVGFHPVKRPQQRVVGGNVGHDIGLPHEQQKALHVTGSPKLRARGQQCIVDLGWQREAPVQLEHVHRIVYALLRRHDRHDGADGVLHLETVGAALVNDAVELLLGGRKTLASPDGAKIVPHKLPHV
mmetsp:Transcript_2355/g.7049  ORF Transcript_2355/g.7049 Transcript_2355/m.7049 type:complete len:295 (+) Transcript_2355:274-1158(+)